jgi:hypothetical protein
VSPDNISYRNRSAGALHGLIRQHGAPEVTVPSNRRHLGITVHRSVADRTVHFGIPVTTPARTLLDLADVPDPDALTRAVSKAHFDRLMSVDALATTRRGERPSGSATCWHSDQRLRVSEISRWPPRP